MDSSVIDGGGLGVTGPSVVTAVGLSPLGLFDNFWLYSLLTQSG